MSEHSNAKPSPVKSLVWCFIDSICTQYHEDLLREGGTFDNRQAVNKIVQFFENVDRWAFDLFHQTLVDTKRIDGPVSWSQFENEKRIVLGLFFAHRKSTRYPCITLIGDEWEYCDGYDKAFPT